ncbi:unnamed protein product [Rotaria sordida]|uniref:Uncharacterized protein n=1 Tax=Rotaria sordida TaxID=392033 RepID=A0A814K7F9_9BILA|nr:unnamed protein product [Rotaria sordida]
MYRSNKLDNIDVLYSLLDVDNQRLNMIVKEKTFTNTLNFVLTTSTDEILSITDPILDRFCISILPKINHNVKSLILESESMERIYLAADYPNLTELKLFNFTDKIASCYFTDESPFRRIFQQQITDLILDSLPNLKCFSLTCRCYTNEYDSQVLPLLHRMSNLEELTLDIVNHDRTTFVDASQQQQASQPFPAHVSSILTPPYQPPYAHIPNSFLHQSLPQYPSLLLSPPREPHTSSLVPPNPIVS